MKTKLLKIIKALDENKMNEGEAERALLEEIFNVTRSSSEEKESLNDFIIESLKISEDKRKLPLLTLCPNDMEVFPSIKMKFENYGSPLMGNKLEAMMITWRD